MTELRRTPLADWHAAHGGRMVEFAGWSMPIQYAGVIAEHQAVRQGCGLFDVSHMAEFRVRGDAARGAIDGLITNDAAALSAGGVLYTALCREDGGVLDDLLVYCLAEDDWMIVANASNHAKVAAWLQERLPSGLELRDDTMALALFALQGPASREILSSWERVREQRARIESLDYYRAFECAGDAPRMLISRTGYTGEWGYELYVPVADARTAWEELLAAGEPHGLVPCGLGARDTLRLEAGFSLYGHELGEDCTPLEAGIAWVVRAKKASAFVGRGALVAQKDAGVPRRTIALLLPGRNIARQGALVLVGDRTVGVVTSGTFSPTLERGIALARVETAAAESTLHVDIRGRVVEAELAKLPFVPNRTRG